jgi:Tol biopolymer transport system component
MAGTTVRVSALENGVPYVLAVPFNSTPSISDDGRYVVFEATFPINVFFQGSIVTQELESVFLKDTLTGQLFYVSLGNDGSYENDISYAAVISRNGRYVAFESGASNLVSGDTNFATDVFVRDLVTGTTTRVSVDSNSNQAIGATVINPDVDRASGVDGVSISADGRYVAFGSRATNLVANDTNNSSDVFVRDLVTGTTTRVSTDSSGNQANFTGITFGRDASASSNPSISADGRYVAFQSLAPNLVPEGKDYSDFDIFVKDRVTGKTTRVSVDSNGNEGIPLGGIGVIDLGSLDPSISADGRYVAFSSGDINLVPDDSNGVRDIFVHDLLTGETTRVSVDSNGNQANGTSSNPSISADGRYVTFTSDASNLVNDDTQGATDVFVHDRVTGITSRVSVNSQGEQALGGYGGTFSGLPTISGDGRFVAFLSNAANLANDGFVTPQINAGSQIFLRDTRFELPRLNTSPNVGGGKPVTTDNNPLNPTGPTGPTGPTIPPGAILGTSGNDRLIGTKGNDWISGDAGNDFLNGKAGNDILIGGPGRDTLIGGPGKDQFVFTSSNDGVDIIRDFISRQDKINLQQVLDQIVPGGYHGKNAIADHYLRLVSRGSSTRIDLDFNSKQAGGFRPLAIVNNMDISMLGSSRNFLF